MSDVARKMRLFLRFLLPRMWYIRGNEKTTGKPLALIWCGARQQQAYMTDRMFCRGTTRTRCIGRRPIFMLNYVKRSLHCAIAIIAGPRRILAPFRRKDDIFVPWWIDAELSLASALDPIDRPGSLKDDLRRVRNNKLSYELASDFDSYQFFYERLYLPTVEQSHGDAGIASSFDKRWIELQTGQTELMFITMNGLPIGGVMLNYHDEVPALRDLGILDGDKSLFKTGVVTAAYYFAMQRLRQRGHSKICLGLSRAFLNDGVLTFKQKWKPTLLDASRESFLIRVTRLCDASRGFLRASSFIDERRGKIQFALFAANDDDIEVNHTRLDRLTSIYGIDRWSTIDVSGQRPRMRQAS